MFSNPKSKSQGRCLLVQLGQVIILGTVGYIQRWEWKVTGRLQGGCQISHGTKDISREGKEQTVPLLHGSQWWPERSLKF